MLKPALQGVDRGREKLKLRAVDVKALFSRDSIAFVSQRASPATYAWVKVDTSHRHFTPTLHTDTSHRHFTPTLRTDTSHRHFAPTFVST